MGWIVTAFKTSIGKKIIMAVSGLSFCFFLVMHLAGNLMIYRGGDYFNAYAERLHSFEPLVNIFELMLLLLGSIHISFALKLFFENREARPVKYAIKCGAGGRSIGSATMPYTGLLLLMFIFVHLFNFHFVDKSNTSIFSIVDGLFSEIGYVSFYLVSVLAVSIHVSHGFWSAFQTMGINHPKYTNFIKFVALSFAIITGIGFGFIPIYLLSS